MTRLSRLQACRTPADVAALLAEHGCLTAADPLAKLLAGDPGVERVTVGCGGYATLVVSGALRREDVGAAAEAWVAANDVERERKRR